MKDSKLYFILILIAIIIFACIGKCYSQKTLEGFEQSHKIQKTFDKGCISACEDDAKSNGIKNYKKKCEKDCDKITEHCKFHPFNSSEWWHCLKNVNSNITIPHHIKNEKKHKWYKEQHNFDKSNYDDNMDRTLDKYSEGQYNKELRREYKKQLKNVEKNYDKHELDYFPNKGILKSEIPIGDQDLYILKSSIVPPVCPECPTLNCGDCKTKCTPCPPCGRCPEPAFECKKVPNYKAGKTNPYLPLPWLNSFSQFNNQYNT